MRLLRCTFALVLGVQLGAALIGMQAGLLRPAPAQSQAASPLADPISRGFEYACDQGDTTGCVEAASRMIAQDVRLRARGEALLRQTCQQGAGQACYALAKLYDGRMTGEAAPDEARALLYAIEGCERGHADACYDAGLHHLFGGLVSPDHDRAASLFWSGCEYGSPLACMAEIIAREEPAARAEAAPLPPPPPTRHTSGARRCNSRTRALLPAILSFNYARKAHPSRACQLGLEAACGVAPEDAVRVANDILCDQGHDAACQRVTRRDPFQPPAEMPTEE